MKDYPIIFSAPMVRALLDGRKSMTRRLKMQRRKTHPSNESYDWYEIESPWVRVKPGDRLWLRENWKAHPGDTGRTRATPAIYRADYKFERMAKAIGGWRSSRFMPRWASRLTLTVTATKIERVQEISEEDARAEGAFECANGWSYGDVSLAGSTARGAFYCLWSSLHGPSSWEVNPEVVCISFAAHKVNIDHMDRAA